MALAPIDALLPVLSGRIVLTLIVAPMPPEEMDARLVLKTSRAETPSDARFEKSNERLVNVGLDQLQAADSVSVYQNPALTELSFAKLQQVDSASVYDNATLKPCTVDDFFRRSMPRYRTSRGNGGTGECTPAP